MNGKEFPETNNDGLAELALSIKDKTGNAIYLIKQTGFPARVVPAKSEPFVIGLPSHDKAGTLRESACLSQK